MLRCLPAVLSLTVVIGAAADARAQARAPAAPRAQGSPSSAPEAHQPAPSTTSDAEPGVPGVAQTPTVPQQTPTTETTPPTTSADAKPSSAFARAAAAVIDAVRIYGLLKPTVTFSSAAVESFGQPNASAVTAAGNPAIAALRNDARLSFQAAQTRFGIWIGEKTRYRGHLEFDFIDFAKASPTTQALLRLRIAAVEWSPTDALTIAVGQDWDLEAPVNAFGVNLVGTHFQSGNHAFMRQQIKALYTFGSALELGAAVGLAGSNAGSKDGPLELGRMPTFALRLTALLGKVGRLGVSGLATRLRFAPGQPDERHALAAVGTVFGDLTPTRSLSVRFEAYAGQNLANLGALAIGSGTGSRDVEEVGGFVSVRQGFLERNAVYATYGHAAALHPSEVAPSYTYPMAAADMPPPLGTATLGASGTGFRRNQSARIGYEFKPAKPLALALDGFWFRTHHQLLAVDQGRLRGKRHAFGGELAALYTF